jgi:hypothetical protein
MTTDDRPRSTGSPQSTAHLLELQTLFSKATGIEAIHLKKTISKILKKEELLVKQKNKPLSQYSEILNLFTPLFVIRNSGS